MITKFGCFPDPVDERDVPLSMFLDKECPLSFERDYLSYFDNVENQKNVSACVGFGCTAIKEAHDKRNGEYTKLSAIWLYDQAKHRDDEPYQEGTYIRVAMKIMAQFGAAPELYVPYADEYTFGQYDNLVIDPSITRPFRIKTYARLVQVDEMCRCLDQHGPFAMGIQVTDSFTNVGSKRIVPVTFKAIEGGHCIAAVGYSLLDGTFTILNSWGQEWGINGTTRIPFEYWEKFGMDAWGIVDISPNEA